MKTRRSRAPARGHRDSQRLIWFARGYADSGSRAEDAFWLSALDATLERLLDAGQDAPINEALDRLAETDERAWGDLADVIESHAESVPWNAPDGAPGRALLIAIPLLLWSRYGVPARALNAATLAALRAQLMAHVLAADVRLVLADHLFSPDQLPQGFSATRRFTAQLARLLESGEDWHVDPRALPPTDAYLSDTRYLLGVVAAPAGRPLFRWNEADGDRQTALQRWQEQGLPNLQAVLPGCAIECTLPNAYFTAWREAERASRPHTLRAAVGYLETALSVPAVQIRAVVAGYYEQTLVEWRVGFQVPGYEGVVHGVVWPLLDAEDEQHDFGEEISRLLRELGLVEIRRLSVRMPLEYCEDCGQPLYPDANGESVHAEMPEETGGLPAQLH